ncbi:MAG: cysteine--tRNA ligase [Anaerolineaceae bacterium]|jgi:L-cysteine:1D-myo-inositol 2-amino-2-deoxy-alpha-D-glucopyranoside ligase
MKLYNSKTQTTEEFTLRDHEVTLYVCGITPYDTTHVGHAFTYTNYDQLIRYLELKGIPVRYAQNVTDIDDDILKRAKETGENWRELGNRWTDHYINDMMALNVRPPDYFPHATDVIPEIIHSVEALIHAGVAYVKNGSVYYEVDRYPEFGQLSHLPHGEMLPIANERGNRPEDPNKRDPLDFVLWQAQAPDEPAWESPWGPGRPGWHIECSTIAIKYLGKTVDIHGGGLDLCFPHHECEIAQVEPVLDHDPYVRYWMHTAMVGYQGEKMSKSLGNLIMVADLLHTYSPDALRLYLGSHHYREAWSYDEKDLQKSQELADCLGQAVWLESGENVSFSPAEYVSEFSESMENDLGTPGAVHALQELARGILEAAKGWRDVKEAQEMLRKYSLVFGLTLGSETPEERVIEGWNAKMR